MHIAVNYFFTLFFVLEHLVQTLTDFPSIFFFWMLIFTFRRFLILEWLRVAPETVPRPQIWQTLLIIVESLKVHKVYKVQT
jgi:hypothetical protein